MTFEEIYNVARRQPFVPFLVLLTTGQTHDIRHPDLIMVGRRWAVIGITKEPEGTVADRSLLVDLLHIVGLEQPLPTASNGSP